MENDRGFFDKVYEVVKLIPHGRVTTYGAIARYLGSPGSARMVGWAMNQSHHAKEFIPAHRVVNRKGMLTGKHHFDGPEVMAELLSSEGIVILDSQIKDFDHFYWDPVEELGL